jgi:hypothetical protein
VAVALYLPSCTCNQQQKQQADSFQHGNHDAGMRVMQHVIRSAVRMHDKDLRTPCTAQDQQQQWVTC